MALKNLKFFLGVITGGLAVANPTIGFTVIFIYCILDILSSFVVNLIAKIGGE